MKNITASRPSVGLTLGEDAFDDEADNDVDAFFAPSAGKVSTVASHNGNVVNGELDKG